MLNDMNKKNIFKSILRLMGAIFTALLIVRLGAILSDNLFDTLFCDNMLETYVFFLIVVPIYVKLIIKGEI